MATYEGSDSGVQNPDRIDNADTGSRAAFDGGDWIEVEFPGSIDGCRIHPGGNSFDLDIKTQGGGTTLASGVAGSGSSFVEVTFAETAVDAIRLTANSISYVSQCETNLLPLSSHNHTIQS